MKKLPEFAKAHEEMEPGRLTRGGLLGEDVRPIEQIVAEDRAAAKRLGVEMAHLAERLDTLTVYAIEAMGAPVTVGDICVSALEGMGKLPCPFSHHGLYSKAVLRAENSATNQKLSWSALSVHMLLEHDFCGGRGSSYRLDIAEVARFFGEPCLTGRHDKAGSGA